MDSLSPQFDQETLRKLFLQPTFELFLICDMRGRKRHTDLETIHTLSSLSTCLGTSIKAALGNSSLILDSFVRSVGDDCRKSEIEAALYLVRHGATVTDRVLSWMCRLPDIRPLDLTLSSIKKLKRLEIAVVRAAERNNFEAVERLIRAGAKLDADFRRIEKPWGRGHYRGPVSIIALIISGQQRNSLPQVLESLVMRGGPLRLSKSRPHLHDLLQSTLDQHGWGSTMPRQRAGLLKTVQYIVGSGYDLRHSRFLTAPLLEACEDTQTFEYLYRNGAQPLPGSPLAAWIGQGGRIKLCREMLRAGADPNAYTRYNRSLRLMTPLQMAAKRGDIDVVELLLLEGAEVNSPAKGRYGSTALQASCLYRPYSSEGQERKLRKIRLLLEHGADLNAAPSCKRKDGVAGRSRIRGLGRRKAASCP